MARKVSITKDMILEAALRMLIRDGYPSINIKSLAAEAGCSTQPIAWHFENMEGLRRALTVYAREYAEKKIATCADNAVDAFEEMGRAYIAMAKNEPNLFRFLYIGERRISKPLEIEGLDITGNDIISGDKDMAAGIARQTGLSYKRAQECIRSTIVYSHGLAVMIASGVLDISEDEAMRMIKHASECFVSGGKHERQGKA